MKKVNFNDGWIFKKDREKQWLNVRLPHDAMTSEGRSPRALSGAGGGYYRGGKYVYKKTFSADASLGKKLILGFGGVYGECFVSVNGKLMAANVYGYQAFYADISDVVRYGQENEIEVAVNNDKVPNSRWYTGSGIYRSVWLYAGGEVRIARGGLKISTPEVAEDVSRTDISIDLVSEQEKTLKTVIENDLYTGDTSPVKVSIVQKAQTPLTKSSPKTVLYLAVGVVLGLIVGVFAALIKDLLKTRSCGRPTARIYIPAV